jgi:hypothetical protein
VVFDDEEAQIVAIAKGASFGRDRVGAARKVVVRIPLHPFGHVACHVEQPEGAPVDAVGRDDAGAQTRTDARSPLALVLVGAVDTQRFALVAS